MAESKCGGVCKCSCKTKIAGLQGTIDVLARLLKKADEVLEIVEEEEAIADSDDSDNLEMLRGTIERVLGQLVAAKLEGRLQVFAAEGSEL